MTAPFPVAARPVAMEAAVFDGSDASAQTIALWVKERGDITDDSRMNYKAYSDLTPRFHFQPNMDSGWDVRAGQYVVRLAPSVYIVLTPEQFELLYQSVDTLLLGQIREIR